MKKHVFLSVMLAICCSAFAAAQGAMRLSVGLGAEGNMNTRENAAFGGSFTVDYGITDAWAAGIKFTASHNFGSTLVLDPTAFGRLYLFKLISLAKVSDTGKTLLGGVYAQVGVGASVVQQKGYDIAPLVTGEAAIGWRFTFGDWYVEPYARFGVPFIWGVGVSGGYRFNLKKR
jgi:hypothetical protein